VPHKGEEGADGEERYHTIKFRLEKKFKITVIPDQQQIVPQEKLRRPRHEAEAT